MKKRALIILHPGFEEMEAITPIDLLSRADIEVVQAHIGDEPLVTGRSGITIHTTEALHNISTDTYDAVILPGGPGIMKLRKNASVCKCLHEHLARGTIIACICAAPLLLLDAELIDGIEYTAHPSTIEELPQAGQDPVVVFGHIITSRGAGTAVEFSLAIIEQLKGATIANEISDAICWPHSS